MRSRDCRIGPQTPLEWSARRGSHGSLRDSGLVDGVLEEVEDHVVDLVGSDPLRHEQLFQHASIYA